VSKPSFVTVVEAADPPPPIVSFDNFILITTKKGIFIKWILKLKVQY